MSYTHLPMNNVDDESLIEIPGPRLPATSLANFFVRSFLEATPSQPPSKYVVALLVFRRPLLWICMSVLSHAGVPIHIDGSIDDPVSLLYEDYLSNQNIPLPPIFLDLFMAGVLSLVSCPHPNGLQVPWTILLPFILQVKMQISPSLRRAFLLAGGDHDDPVVVPTREEEVDDDTETTTNPSSKETTLPPMEEPPNSSASFNETPTDLSLIHEHAPLSVLSQKR
jgi:hypothetical protein